MHGENITESFEYARYWHGYLTILRPLLAIANYQTIRIINLIVTCILVITLLYLVYKKINLESAIIIFLGFISVSIFAITQSMNEIGVFLIGILSSIYLLLKKEINKNISINFFVIGSITNFFDLLTAPLITLGLPLVIYFLKIQENRKSLKEDIKDFFKICIAWSFGYGLTWLLKWIITSVIYKRPIISQAIEQAKYRSKSISTKLNYIYNIKRNLAFLSEKVIITMVLIAILYIIVKLIIMREKKINWKENLYKSIPFILITILPFVWYFALKQHSIIHSFFTYRILSITIIGFLITINKLIRTEKNKI